MPSPTEPTLDAGDGAEVLQVLGQLNERYQRAISLRYLSGLAPRTRPRHGAEQGHVRGGAAPGHGALRKAIDQQTGGGQNLAELHDELERLGNRPVPVLDDARIEALEQRLLDEFVARPPPRLSRSWLLPAAGAARCSWAEEAQRPPALAAAIVIAQEEAATYEVRAAIGAVAMYPDGASRTVQAGDHALGGLIRPVPKAPSPSRRRRSARIT